MYSVLRFEYIFGVLKTGTDAETSTNFPEVPEKTQWFPRRAKYQLAEAPVWGQCSTEQSALPVL